MSFAAALENLRSKQLDRLLPALLRDRLGRSRGQRGVRPRHVLFALCDHFEPLWGKASDAVGNVRVERWMSGYPAIARRFRDSNGRHPRHSFFFPGEEYRPFYLDGLGELVASGLGEVELHLHHDGDDVASLRKKIEGYLGEFASHGHLAREAGRPRYAFIHGNWCLANARKDGRWCGVDAELPLLFDTGCYADFTFPAGPEESQPSIVNQIYWPSGDLARRRAFEHGERAEVGRVFRDRILLIQGPLWIGPMADRRWGFGLEYGDLTLKDPPSAARVRRWVDMHVHVAGRPDWIFIKVHTHGAQEAQSEALLGPAGVALHQALAELDRPGDSHLHYVTAREMYNVAMAAMDGRTGNPSSYFDYLLPPPPAATR
jgi:hypothetical protein